MSPGDRNINDAKRKALTLRELAAIALNFVRTDTRESCTRLCAIMCCSTGCFVGLGATGFAFAHPGATGAIVALTGIEAGLITSGCTALLARSRASPGAPGSPGGSS
jgi:hypothetical protein